MTATITVETATAGDSHEMAVMVGELPSEIMNTIGVQAFNFNLEETTGRLRDFLNREKYFVFIAHDEGKKAVGFLALYESPPFMLMAHLELYQSFMFALNTAQTMWGSASCPKQNLSAHLGAGSV